MHLKNETFFQREDNPSSNVFGGNKKLLLHTFFPETTSFWVLPMKLTAPVLFCFQCSPGSTRGGYPPLYGCEAIASPSIPEPPPPPKAVPPSQAAAGILRPSTPSTPSLMKKRVQIQEISVWELNTTNSSVFQMITDVNSSKRSCLGYRYMRKITSSKNPWPLCESPRTRYFDIDGGFEDAVRLRTWTFTHWKKEIRWMLVMLQCDKIFISSFTKKCLVFRTSRRMMNHQLRLLQRGNSAPS